MARHFIDVFWPLIDSSDVDAIVAPSGSCVAMVRNHYPMLFETDKSTPYLSRAVAVADVIFELTQYLVDKLGVRDSGASCSGRLTYHPCCHLLREMGVDAQPRALISNIHDADVVDLPNDTECCGFGGLFAVKNAEISTEIGRRKVRNIEDSGADMVAVNDVSCMTHINGLLKRQGNSQRMIHIAELLNRKRPE
jgi:L-lactate dehydrogenase complex protein LldE